MSHLAPRLRTSLLAFAVASAFIVAACSDEGDSSPVLDDAGAEDASAPNSDAAPDADVPDAIVPPAPDGGYDCSALDCDDGDVCTIDACSAELGCTHAPRDGAVTFDPATSSTTTGGTTTIKAMDGNVDVSSCVTWSTGDASIGTMSGGTFTAGTVGGEVEVHAKLGETTSSTKVVVVAKVQANSGGLTPEQRALLDAPSMTADPSTITYPENGTVFPLDIESPEIHVGAALATDVFRVRLSSKNFDATDYVTGGTPTGTIQVPASVWDLLGRSGQGAESDPVTVSITRLRGDVAYAPITSTWHIAQARLNLAAYFVDIWDVPPPNANGNPRVQALTLATGTQKTLMNEGTCTSCHSVSHDGRKLLSSLDIGTPFPLRAADLTTTLPTLGSTKLGGSVTGTFSAFSPDGSRALIGNDAANSIYSLSLVDVAGGTVRASNVLGAQCAEPAWAKEGTTIAAVCDITGSGWAFDASKGKLRIGKLAADGVTVDTTVDLASSSDGLAGRPSYPKLSSDGTLVTYARTTAGSRSTGDGTLWVAATDGSFAKQLTVAGRSKSFYPAFAPRRAGGYYWIAFTSQRNDFVNDGRRHMWMAAIKDTLADADPSRPAFLIPGQSMNAKAYEPNLAPLACVDDGATCRFGTDCCSGTCVPSANGASTCGAPVAGACVEEQNRCNVTADCCGRALACIDNVCQSSKF